MPKVLCDLRIDEISRVDRGAVTRVVLMKRKPQSICHGNFSRR
jgi:hypothetical protein